ncbi:hypothetical protein MRB53_038524 [Persea americana]|nr:hypothetical protein MRB53_038524 [Persea americana]
MFRIAAMQCYDDDGVGNKMNGMSSSRSLVRCIDFHLDLSERRAAEIGLLRVRVLCVIVRDGRLDRILRQH